MDAPELHQTCDDGRWTPGPLARDALSAFIAGQPVECQPITRDRYGRTVARCYAGGQDLGALMVGAGWAWAFTRYSLDYVGLETAARAGGLGVHGHDCERADAYRARLRANGGQIQSEGPRP
jgi:endonuclease YncB( thermonuclease family)